MHFEAGRAAGAAMTDPIDWRRIWSTVPAMNNAEQPSPELYRGLAETDALAELAIGVGPRVRISLPPPASLRTLGPLRGQPGYVFQPWRGGIRAAPCRADC